MKPSTIAAFLAIDLLFVAFVVLLFSPEAKNSLREAPQSNEQKLTPDQVKNYLHQPRGP